MRRSAKPREAVLSLLTYKASAADQPVGPGYGSAADHSTRPVRQVKGCSP